MFKSCIALSLVLAHIIRCGPVPDHIEVHAVDDIPGRTALDNFPLVDGHNDLAWILLLVKQNQLNNTNLHNFTETIERPQGKHTDLDKLKAGKVGAQFWAAFITCDSQFKDAVEQTLEQIDVIKRFIQKYPGDLQYVSTADGILDAFKNKKIGSLLAIESGHGIANRLSILRMYYELGVRYMTLTHSCNTPWADASPLDTHSVHNVTDFGKTIIWEMNRLGMMVDLAHVSYGTMVHVLNISKAPVIFSHSSAYSIHPHHRNVRDDVLQLLKINNGIIMVNFYSGFIATSNATIDSVVNHINHIVGVCGIDCVGIGSDYSGVEEVPIGLEDASKYPDLFDLLRKSNPSKWTIANLEKLAGRNLVRVFKEVEKVRDYLKDEQPYEAWIPEDDLNKLPEETKGCKTIPNF